MARVYNFSAGPAVLPEEVLKEAAEEMLDYRGCGMSVMEMSHRSKMFDDIIKTAEADLRELMNIPDNYKVLFLQGGASQQFSAIPMNLMKNKVADFIITGQWAKKAYQEASRIWKSKHFRLHQKIKHIHIFQIVLTFLYQKMQIMYMYAITTRSMEQNISRFQIQKVKSLLQICLLAFLSEPVNVEDFGVIYFGVQKKKRWTSRSCSLYRT